MKSNKYWLALLLSLLVAGCESKKPATPSVGTDLREGVNAGSPLARTGIASSIVTDVSPLPERGTDFSAKLIDSQLSVEQLREGWIRLYDGRDLNGWFAVGPDSWASNDGAILVDGGEPTMLCTIFQLSDFELLVDFKCSEKTESGILLRTSADPRDLSRECYKVAIAPSTSEYPTGSLSHRQKIDIQLAGEIESNQWHTMRILVQGDSVKVSLNGNAILDYTDEHHLARGYIALQHKRGVIRFRNILMRPIGGHDLAVDQDWQRDWKQLANASPDFRCEPSESGLHLQGGPGQLESKQQWDDFVLQASYQVANANVDSGILFRALPDRYNEAYECQIYHGELQNAPDRKIKQYQTGTLNIPVKTEPVNARMLISDGTSTTYMTIIADEGQFAAFVDGLLVADIADTREVSANPRVGFRREAGRIGLQAHDEACDITFSRISIAPIRKH